MTAQELSGEYHLTGVHEMAAAFQFRPDGTFSFNYMYGAVDRFAEGTYTVEGDTIKLKSDKEPGKDFIVQNQSKQGTGYTIHVRHASPYLINHVRCICFNGDGEIVEDVSGNDGVIRLDVPGCTKIFLQHMLYPDIASMIKDEDNTNNTFEVTLAGELEKVSFKGIDLRIEGDTLTCWPNYFMPMENIRFVKMQ